MTTRQADRLIESGAQVSVRSAFYGERFVAVFVSRDRFTITASDGGKYDRADLLIVKHATQDA